MKTAVYVRVSTEQQSFDSQLLELAAYCDRRGWTDRVVFEDKASGAKTSRAGFDAMLSEARKGKLARVVVFKLDRLGRSLTHLALVLEELARLNVAMVATSQGIDTSNDSPVGQLQLGVLMAVAQFERAIIKERVNAGIAAAKARGVRFGRETIHADKASSAKELRAKGLSFRVIAKQLGTSAMTARRLATA